MIKNLYRGLRRIFYDLQGGYPALLAGEPFMVDTAHIGFWKNATHNLWEPETFKVLEDNLHADAVYLDIGSWIGPTVLYASRICQQVYCVEPDPVAHKYLSKNIANNQLTNVASYQVALSGKSGMQTMSSLNHKLGDSMTSLIANHDEASQTFSAQVLDWKGFLKKYHLPIFSFIKIDIEGGEFQLLPTMEVYLIKHKPVLWLSIHPELLDQDVRMQELLTIAQILKFYTYTYDSNFKPVHLEKLIRSKALVGYPAFLFKM